jgi:hypothetical protein
VRAERDGTETNSRAVYEIGDTEVNFSDEEAIVCALEHLENHFYFVGTGDSAENFDQHIVQKDIVTEDITVGLKTTQETR